MYVYINGKRLNLDPTKSIGKGGEADVYDIGSGLAGKIFKTPDHPDFENQPVEQHAAKMRLEEHQRKLPAFPKGLPETVITPQDLLKNQAGDRIHGYTMKFIRGAELLLRYSQQDFRQAGVSSNEVVEVFRNLHTTVDGIHKAKAVIGDFNDLNCLVLNKQVYIIDADSFAFEQFPCRVFTQRFVDPTLCDPNANAPLLMQPHNDNSDWYAFSVMLMQSLLFVDPYGGMYRPKDPSKRIPHDKRPLLRVTVFDPEVRYPKPAIPYGRLPDDLLQYYHKLLKEDARGTFPFKLLQQLRWTVCTQCGTEHARGACPECKFAAPGAVKEVTQVHGQVIISRIFTTPGTILYSTVQKGKLLWLYHESDQFKREGNVAVLPGELDRNLRFRIQGQSTLLGKGNTMVTLTPDKPPSRTMIESVGTLPVFDANSQFSYWIENGRLMRSGEYASEYLGDVLSGQTLFWAGERVGFGFYRAGNLCVFFVFDAKNPGINDRVKLPVPKGQLVDAYCLFSSGRIWFFLSTREAGKTINQCMVLKENGELEASASQEEGSNGWLSTLRGKCATGNLLFAPTDEGIVRVEPKGGSLEVTSRFPDTEPFVNSGSQMHVGADGLYIVGSKEIVRLQLKK